jgi:hypothetical protein
MRKEEITKPIKMKNETIRAMTSNKNRRAGSVEMLTTQNHILQVNIFFMNLGGPPPFDCEKFV